MANSVQGSTRRLELFVEAHSHTEIKKYYQPDGGAYKDHTVHIVMLVYIHNLSIKHCLSQ